MKDHLRGGARNARPAHIIGVRDLKTHASRILRQVRDARASYILTHRGQTVGVILPVDPAESSAPAPERDDAVAAWDNFIHAGQRVARRFRRGVSGVRILSSMRR